MARSGLHKHPCCSLVDLACIDRAFSAVSEYGSAELTLMDYEQKYQPLML
jgi:hypothetical protein